MMTNLQTAPAFILPCQHPLLVKINSPYRKLIKQVFKKDAKGLLLSAGAIRPIKIYSYFSSLPHYLR
jgi:hypothetical protein